MKHRSDGFGKLGIVSLVDAAGIHPEVLQAIACSLLRTEAKLSVPSLRPPQFFSQVCEADLFIILSPRMRKDSIRGEVIDQIIRQAEIAVLVNLQKTHCSAQAS